MLSDGPLSKPRPRTGDAPQVASHSQAIPLEMAASSLASPAAVPYEEIEAGETTHNGFEMSGPLSISIIHQVIHQNGRISGPLHRDVMPHLLQILTIPIIAQFNLIAIEISNNLENIARKGLKFDVNGSALWKHKVQNPRY